MFVLLFTLFGCPKQVTPVADVPRIDFPQADVPKASDADIDAMKLNFTRVNFAFDSDRITNPGVLTANAKLLQENPAIRVEVQGHADDRGTSEYNLALGERRAAAIVRRLTSDGVPRNRLETVSFGEERPLMGGEGESVWAENRRAEFRVVGGTSVAGTTR